MVYEHTERDAFREFVPISQNIQNIRNSLDSGIVSDSLPTDMIDPENQTKEEEDKDTSTFMEGLLDEFLNCDKASHRGGASAARRCGLARASARTSLPSSCYSYNSLTLPSDQHSPTSWRPPFYNKELFFFVVVPTWDA